MSQFEKLTKQPLVMVLAEFRFSTVLQIEKYIPQFQDHVRQKFPHFSTFSQQEIVVEPQGLKVNQNDVWLFQSVDKKSAFHLDKDRISFLTADYNRFPDFLSQCQTAIEFVETVIKPALILRIGLRYSDVILESSPEEKIEDYVQEAVCNTSVGNVFDGQIRHSNESILKTEHGVLVVKTLYGYSNITVWQDLVEVPIAIKKASTPSKRILLDFDHYWSSEEQEESQYFNKEFILQKVDGLHENSRKAFWDITTDTGREVWK